MTDIENRIKTTICSALKIPDSLYSNDLGAGDIPQWDSLGHLNLISSVEKEFNVAFDVGDVIDVQTVNDLIDLVERYSKPAIS